ncbi:MAG: hypothetical protein ABI210_09390 [Abditibacteriaceae bacterium]
MKQQSWSKAKRWFAWLGGGVIILCLAADGFWYWINIPPQIKIPTPVMPHPNGYDYFVRAGAAFVNDNKGVDEITSTSSKPEKYPLAAKEEWLKQNAKAFQLLREGLKYPVLQPAVRSYDDEDYHSYAQFRNLARALVVESHARGERGDWNGAVQSLLDDYDFGNQIARGGPLITGLVSVAIQDISLREFNNLVSHTNATTAKMVAASIEKLYDQRYPYYKNLEEEKWRTLAEMLELMKHPAQQLNSPSWRVGMIGSFRFAIFEYLKIFSISKRKVIHDLTKSMDEGIENAQRPYLEQLPVIASGDPLAEALLPVDYKMARWNWARSDTYSVEVMTMFALRAYKLDNGHYPTNLKALVPTYLHKVPIDPFDGIAPLHYQLHGEKYLLWSIGPDGVDNHGAPITNKYQKRAPYINWSWDSKGDVVAGKNMP